MSKGSVIYRVSLVSVLAVAALGSTVALIHRGDDYTFLDDLIEVKHVIATRFVDEPDMNKLKQGAIKGMVEALNDPYTVYVPPVEQREFNKQLTGEYVGIGAQVNTADGYLTIVSPLEDTPAFRAGLMPEDKVLEIDGKSTKDLPVEKCIDLLTGTPGTPVTLTIERKGEKLTVTITRERIKTRSIKGFRRETDDPNQWRYVIDPERRIAYVRMTQFTPQVAGEVATALQAAGADPDPAKNQLKGLILDLRFNPGGLLNEATAIADMFLKDGVIVSTRGRAFPEVVSKAHQPGTLPDFPIVVMVNGQSASASEVLSGALVENDRAIVLGTRSFGKGSVQSLMEVGDHQGELKITEQGYFLPSGRSISRKDDSAKWGVDPSEGFYVPMSDAETLAMLDVRRKEEILRASSPAGAATQPEEHWSDPAWIESNEKDKQLAAALKAVQLRIESGKWEPTGEKTEGDGKLATVDELRKIREYRERLLRELDRTDKREVALSTAAGGEADKANVDLWDNKLDVTGGQVIVKDKDGNVVATLAITGPNLERWLMDADVKRSDEAKPAEKKKEGDAK